MKIRILSQTLINQISAGEVVERPASVVKELIENAIDAKASNINITIRNGGKSLISIVDDGIGMSKENLDLSIERHATSKINDQNLFNIKTLGFRGEALPSIGAISRLKITSRTIDSENGWSILIEGGIKQNTTPASSKTGTKVEVKDLFFATPARLKFLKSANTELNYIIDIINKIAISHPKINFYLKDENNTLIDFNESSNTEEKTINRLSKITGVNFTDNTFPIDIKYDNIKLTGYISSPTINRSSLRFQYFYVNKRYIRDKLFNNAIRIAYQDLLPKDRYPLIALFLEINPEEVDMNVHPAKVEIRFRNATVIKNLIISTLKNTLKKTGSITSTNIPVKTINTNYSRQNYHASYNSLQLKPKSFFTNETKTYEKNEFKSSEQEENLDSYPLGLARAQIHETYIISETKNALIIIDQHAAHERIRYEEIKKEFKNDKIKSQTLLIPEIVELLDTEIEKIIQYQDQLIKFGIDIEKFGEGTLIVRSIPAIIGQKIDIKNFIKDLSDELHDLEEITILKEKIQKICSTKACHTSIRSGKKLTFIEMDTLLRKMETTLHSGQCSHGRPTYIKLQKSDIEKLFERR